MWYTFRACVDHSDEVPSGRKGNRYFEAQSVPTECLKFVVSVEHAADLDDYLRCKQNRHPQVGVLSSDRSKVASHIICSCDKDVQNGHHTYRKECAALEIDIWRIYLARYLSNR